MAESHVISALVSKRSELAGLLNHHKQEIARISQELGHIDHTIKIFDPDYRIKSIKPKKYRQQNQFFKSGEANRLLLDILRDSGEPMTTVAIVDEAIKRKSLELDAEQIHKIKASIGNTLKSQSKKGLIQELDKQGNMAVWNVR